MRILLGNRLILRPFANSEEAKGRHQLTKSDPKAADSSKNATTLARTWADAPLLTKFVRDRAEPLAGEIPGAVPLRTSSPMERLALYAQFQTNLMVASDQAIRDTKNDLVAGRLVGLGRASGSRAIEAIDPLFWIGAEVDSDSATSDNNKFIDIRIAKPGTIPSLQTRLQSGSGRPSKAEVIRAAIAEFAKTDPGLDRPRPERFQYYYSFFTSHGFNLKDPGFDKKTIEKYESEHRKKFR